MRDDTNSRHERKQLRWMRAVSLLEGVTLVLLVFVAVPLKHLAGYGEGTATMGPIHGMAFLLYIWALAQTSTSLDWSKREVIRLFLFACIPFGAFVNERTLRRKEASLALSS